MTVRRIAIVSDSFPPHWGGGITSAHYQLFRILRKKGFDVRAFTFFDNGPADDGEADIVRHGPPRGAVRLVRRLANLVFRFIDPGRAAYQVADIVVRAWGAWRLNAALARFQPQILVCPDHGSPALFLQPIAGCRRVLVAHHNPSRFADLPFIEPHSETDVRLAIAAEQRTLGRIDKVIAPSHYMKRVFEGTYKFDGPVEVIPNLVDGDFVDSVPPHDLRGLLGLPPGAPLVYVPGGGNKFKGAGFIPDLLRALAQRSAGPLGIFLSGAVPEETRAMLAGLPKGLRIHAPGPLDGPVNLGRVKACSFGVYPTLAENYSMALLEAALCGVPMVTFDVGGNGEIIRDGTNGFLVPAHDVGALATAAARLLDPTTARQMAETTHDDAKARLDTADAWIAGLTQFDGS